MQFCPLSASRRRGWDFCILNVALKIILGTGLSGLVGSRIVELLSNKYKFVNIDLTTGVDITDLHQVEQKIYYSKSDILIHLAAYTDVSKAWEQKNDKNGLCYKVNVIGAKNIAQVCQKTHKYLIHFSTDFVFDGKNTPAGGYTERDKPHPIEWYGQTKLWAENEVLNSGCKNIILRIAFPFKGSSASRFLEPKPKIDLVRNIKSKLENGEEIKMFFDQIITPTYIDDIAKVIDYCFENQPQGLYHCVGSSSLSPYDLAFLIADNWQLDKNLIKKTTVKEFNQLGLRPRQVNMAISNKKIEKKFGIKMSSLKEALVKIKI